MDSQMESNFFQHVLRFFTQQYALATPAPATADGAPAPAPGGPAPAPAPGADPRGSSPDLPQLVTLLRAAGFRVTYNDKSEVGGSSEGCRLILVCKRSGCRVVMDSVGTCACPPEDELKRLLQRKELFPEKASASATTTPATSPIPAAAKEAEDSIALGEEASTEPPKLVRQRTWSREDELPDSGDLRRQSAPPVPVPSVLVDPMSSPWATVTGDELNVAAAADLLREALSLLSGVKRPPLRNAPIMPGRGVVGRRVSSDAYLLSRRSGSQQQLSLSRSSSVSSGLASSYSSREQLAPTREQPSGVASKSLAKQPLNTSTRAALRRTLSSAASTGRKAGDSASSTSSANTRLFGTKLPTYMKAGQPKAPRGIPSPRQPSTRTPSKELPISKT